MRVRRSAVQAARHQGHGGVETGTSRVFADDLLDGKVALVTGGGTNLGKAAAAELARCGAAVVIAGQRERLNVRGTRNMSQAAHDLAMAPAGSGTIVNVTVSPHHAMQAMAHTGAARAMVEQFTRELAKEWESDGIALAALALGRFATESIRKYPAELWRQDARSVYCSQRRGSNPRLPPRCLHATSSPLPECALTA